MRVFIPFALRRKLFVFFGLLPACAFDLGVKARAQDLVLHQPESQLYGLILFWVIAFLALAVLLERYVRPLSRMGAISTGFCGYALMSFLIL